MKHNARYKGGSGTGVDLTVLLADGQQRPRHIDQGEPLPADIGGIPVDPAYVDSLLEQHSEWELVDNETKQQRAARKLAEEHQAVERVKAEQTLRGKDGSS